MKAEDQAGVELAQKGALGEVTFLRYSLTVNQQHQSQEEAILSEVFDWLKGAGATELKSISASYGRGKKVLIITMAFTKNILANLFINMESTRLGFNKKTELAGTESLYVFDSASETAFSSDCIAPSDYQFTKVNPDNHEWLNVINASLISGEVETVK